jgi:hypothetical protein
MKILTISYGIGVIYTHNGKLVPVPKDKTGNTPWDKDDGTLDIHKLVTFLSKHGFTHINHQQFYEDTGSHKTYSLKDFLTNWI